MNTKTIISLPFLAGVVFGLSACPPEKQQETQPSKMVQPAPTEPGKPEPAKPAQPAPGGAETQPY